MKLTNQEILKGCALIAIKECGPLSPAEIIYIIVCLDNCDTVKNFRRQLKIEKVETDTSGPDYEWPKSKERLLVRTILKNDLTKETAVEVDLSKYPKLTKEELQKVKKRRNYSITENGERYLEHLKWKGFKLKDMKSLQKIGRGLKKN